MKMNVLKKIMLPTALFSLISAAMADTVAVKPYSLPSQLTRNLTVMCGGGTTVSLQGNYFQADDGSWSGTPVNGTATTETISTNVGTVMQTFGDVSLIASDTSQYLNDAITDGQVLKAQVKDLDGSILADIQLTLFPNTCSPSDGYTTAFAATCKGFVMVGSHKRVIDADTNSAVGATNWTYSVPGQATRSASTARTLSGVLVKTKNLTDFTQLGADHCPAPSTN